MIPPQKTIQFSIETSSQSGGTWDAYGYIDWLLVFCLFSIYAGSATPEVNESHYWVKASHFWNPNFASGDLFVQSKDAHWFFFATFGALTQYLSLPVATWIGRILGWTALSFAWCYFVRRFSLFSLPGAITTGAWIATTHCGHLSGEWVVGGCEAKVFAYAAAFLGMTFFLDKSYGWGWIWMGIASAFHVLTGAWVVIAAMLVLGWSCFVLQQKGDRILSHWNWVGLMAGGAISLLGLVPALALNSGVSLADQDRGAVIYVFQRLPHHLVPTRFAVERWWSFAGLLSLAAGCIWMVRVQFKFSDSEPSLGGILRRFAILQQLAVAFLFVAIVGLMIDLVFSSWATNWSAELLRYYWFRWNDVIWPTVITISLLLLIEFTRNKSPFFIGVAVCALVLPGVFVVGNQYIRHYSDSISPADQATLLLRNETRSVRNQVYSDWLDICAFIHANTPEDAVFLTPRFQQTFKWNTGRAEVVCWKDSPQDARGLIEWESRLLKVFPRDENGHGMPWSDRLLYQLSNEYNIDYVLIDRRIQKTPPILEFIQSNATYALFRVISTDK